MDRKEKKKKKKKRIDREPEWCAMPCDAHSKDGWGRSIFCRYVCAWCTRTGNQPRAIPEMQVQYCPVAINLQLAVSVTKAPWTDISTHYMLLTPVPTIRVPSPTAEHFHANANIRRLLSSCGTSAPLRSAQPHRTELCWWLNIISYA